MRVALRHLLALLLGAPCITGGALGAQSRAQATTAVASTPPAASAVRDAATLHIAVFLRRWREAWQASELKRHRVTRSGSSTPGFGGDVRLQRLHCHGDHGVQGVEIRSASRLRVCPGWTPQKHDTIPGDEREDADAALLPAQRDTVRGLRAALLDGLATLAAASGAEADPWLLGQRVRFTIDARDTAAARALVRQCAADDAWCLLLAAHVEHELGSVAEAEPRWAAALAAMPAEERCRWSDVEPLLDGREAQARFRALPCERRIAEARRFWWLADPLWSDAGNERWSEDMARRTTVALRSAVEQDDRMHWRRAYGGDAMAAMVIRYGWPAYFWWGGEVEDASHREWTQQVEQRWGVPPQPVFWSAEYPVGRRLQVTPDEAQWSTPFASDAWTPADVQAPAGRERRWKPREHWAPATPFAPLADVQVALLPRAEGTLVVAQTEPALVVGRRLLVPEGDTLVAALVLATGPDSTTVLAERRVGAASRVAVAGLAPSSPTGTPTATIVALELRAARAAPGARGAAPRAPRRRARVGLTLPPPLSAMAPGTRAISAPVLLEATDDHDADTTDALARRMLGGTRLGERVRVALYWETYGFARSDSLEVTMRLTRLDRGALARLAGALRVPGFSSEGRDATAARWREAPTGDDSSGTGAPRVATRAWLRTLDLRALPAGRYELEVAVGRPGEVPVAGRRRFTTRK